MEENVGIPPAADGSPALSESSEGTPAVETPQMPDVPSGLKNVDPAKLAELREKLAKFATGGKKTMSGSEAPADAPPEQAVTTGKDVDWSEYDLDFSVRHLYKDATFRMTPQGPKWVALVDEFYSTTRDFRNHGKKVNSARSTEQEPVNLGEYLSDMLNSPEGWRVISVLPASMDRAGVLLQRSVPVVLPDPKPLEKKTEVEAPKDGELVQVEAAAKAFMESEGLTPPTEETQSSLEQQAIALNGPADRDPRNVLPTMSASMVRDAARDAAAAMQGVDFGDDPAPIIEKLEKDAKEHYEAGQQRTVEG